MVYQKNRSQKDPWLYMPCTFLLNMLKYQEQHTFWACCHTHYVHPFLSLFVSHSKYSTFKVISHQHNNLCSSPPPLIPERKVFRNHIVLSKLIGVLVSRQPFSYSKAISLLSSIGSARFGILPLHCVFKFFCLHLRTSLVLENS